MRYYIYTLAILFYAQFLLAQNAKDHPLIVDIQLNDRLQMQVNASIGALNNKAPITIFNGKEVYQLSVKKRIGDTIVYQFPAQDAEWRVAFEKDFSEARGWWINYNKKVPVRYPIHLYMTLSEMLAKPDSIFPELFGRWKVLFEPGTPNEEVLVGVFQQEMNGRIFGSFLSETGDYRYLHGFVANGKLHLQTYTGYWAFVVEADLNGSNEMSGVFYSGGKSRSPFKAIKDETVQLRDESSLTYLIKRDEPVLLKDLIKMNGRKTTIDFAAEKQLTLIQIMGTWCPNCLDEVQFMNQLHKGYEQFGLEIVALAYEVGTDEKQTRKKLKAFKKKIGMEYDLVLAGKSSKEVASDQFPMLNGIMSFPTTVIIGKDGKVLHVHTGYSGPATGSAHKELTDKIQLEIEMALDILK